MILINASAANALAAQWYAGLRAVTPLEAIAVVAGIVYVYLILRRNRWGWVAGALSSIIYVALAARAGLPMQSALQVYYVMMAVYGWVSWTRNAAQQAGRIFRWPLRYHLIAAVLIGVSTVLCSRVLAHETHAAWPILDSITTFTSLLATWLVAQSVLENWCYWLCADAITVFLYTKQGYSFTATLFLTYMIFACFGLRSWWRRYRQQPA